MGAFLDKPKTEKSNESGEGNGVQYALSYMQGWRVEMEDAHSAVTAIPCLPKWSFFAVFDGHAGKKVSEFCSTDLLKRILETDDFKGLDPDAVPLEETVKNGIRDGFLNLDRDMRLWDEVVNGDDKSGSTAVCVVISPSKIFFANCGDSRAILVRSGNVHYSTKDHKPVNQEEKERIQNAGGSVMIQRVNGSLAVSRALGDYDYKNTEGKKPTEQMVSPEPETVCIERDRTKDEFIVLACDGVWDVMTNEDISSFISHRLRVTDDIEIVCNEVLDTCFCKGSRDNMSVVLIKLDAAPKPDPDCIAKDKAVDEKLTNLVQEIFREKLPTSHKDLDGNNIQDFIDITHIQDVISREEIEDLPPGGGINAKRTHIDQVYNKLCDEYNNRSGSTSQSKAGISDGLLTNNGSINSSTTKDKSHD